MKSPRMLPLLGFLASLVACSSSSPVVPIRDPVPVLARTVSGMVLGPKGLPLARAQVSLLGPLPRDFPQVREVSYVLMESSFSDQMTSDAGAYEFRNVPPGKFVVRVRASGFATALGARINEHEQQHRDAFVLSVEEQLRGRVLDVEGVGIQGASVSLFSQWGPLLQSVQSDETGAFLLPGCSHSGGTVVLSAEGYAIQRLPGVLPRSDLEISLNDTWTIKGKFGLPGSTNRGIEDLSLTAKTDSMDLPISIPISDSGDFEITGMDRSEVLLELFHRERGVLFLEVIHPAGDMVDIGTVELPLTMVPGVRLVAGRVLDEAIRRPAARTRLSLSNAESSYSAKATTDVDGRFRFTDVPEDKHWLSVEGHQFASTSMEIPAGRQDLDDVILSVQLASSLSGRVLTPEGWPAVDACVVFVPLDVEQRCVTPAEWTDEQGRFAFGPIEYRARYRMQAHTQGYGPTPARTIEVDGKKGLSFELRLTEGSSVTVKITDLLGQPLDSVLVSASTCSWDRDEVELPERASVTDHQGMAVIRGLVGGQHILHVYAEGYGRYSREIEVDGSTAIDLGTIPFPGPRALYGTVRRFADGPVAGAKVLIEGRSILTDELGRFSIEGLPRGPMTILIVEGGEEIFNHPLHELPQDAMDIVIDGGTLQFDVPTMDSDERAVVYLIDADHTRKAPKVTSYPVTRRVSPAFMPFQFRRPGIAPGKYRMAVKCVGMLPAVYPGVIDVRPREESDFFMLKLLPGQRVHGEVVEGTAQGEPVRDATATLSYSGEWAFVPPEIEEVDQWGRLSLGRVAAGTHELVVETPDGRRVTQAVVVEASSVALDLGKIVLPPKGSK